MRCLRLSRYSSPSKKFRKNARISGVALFRLPFGRPRLLFTDVGGFGFFFAGALGSLTCDPIPSLMRLPRLLLSNFLRQLHECILPVLRLLRGLLRLGGLHHEEQHPIHKERDEVSSIRDLAVDMHPGPDALHALVQSLREVDDDLHGHLTSRAGRFRGLLRPTTQGNPRRIEPGLGLSHHRNSLTTHATPSVTATRNGVLVISEIAFFIFFISRGGELSGRTNLTIKRITIPCTALIDHAVPNAGANHAHRMLSAQPSRMVHAAAYMRMKMKTRSVIIFPLHAPACR